MVVIALPPALVHLGPGSAEAECLPQQPRQEFQNCTMLPPDWPDLSQGLWLEVEVGRGQGW